MINSSSYTEFTGLSYLGHSESTYAVLYSDRVHHSVPSSREGCLLHPQNPLKPQASDYSSTSQLFTQQVYSDLLYEIHVRVAF